jgi:hypothetical protein
MAIAARRQGDAIERGLDPSPGSFDDLSPHFNEVSMNIDKRWVMLLAVAASAAAGVAVALQSQRRRHRVARNLEHKSDVSSWENEGGNLTPVPADPVVPALP